MVNYLAWVTDKIYGRIFEHYSIKGQYQQALSYLERISLGKQPEVLRLEMACLAIKNITLQQILPVVEDRVRYDQLQGIAKRDALLMDEHGEIDEASLDRLIEKALPKDHLYKQYFKKINSPIL